jgi:hypothetical protein
LDKRDKRRAERKIGNYKGELKNNEEGDILD